MHIKINIDYRNKNINTFGDLKHIYRIKIFEKNSKNILLELELKSSKVLEYLVSGKGINSNRL